MMRLRLLPTCSALSVNDAFSSLEPGDFGKCSKPTLANFFITVVNQGFRVRFFLVLVEDSSSSFLDVHMPRIAEVCSQAIAAFSTITENVAMLDE